MVERGFEPWNRAHLLTDVLPLLDGVVERLRAGCAVADVGCGAGGAVLLMAEAFPTSSFVGYDISAPRPRSSRATPPRGGCRPMSASSIRATSHSRTTGRSGFVTTFDCLHDMTDPAGTARTIFDALAPDGTWLLVDIKALDTFAENVRRNPMAALMYGVSVLSCLSSSLSVDGGAGLGTLGLPESVARRLAGDAGFSRFRRLAVDHPTNAFYEIRPVRIVPVGDRRWRRVSHRRGGHDRYSCLAR